MSENTDYDNVNISGTTYGDTTIPKNDNVKSFEDILIFLKLYGVIFVIYGAYINYDIAFIKNNIGLFFTETILYAIVGAISIAYIYYRRNNNKLKSKSLLYTFLLWFLIYFCGHILLQLSGIYTVMYSKHSTENNHEDTIVKEKINKNTKLIDGFKTTATITVFIPIILLILSLFYFAYSVGDTIGTKDGLLPWFIIETIIFSVLNTVPLFFICKNRQKFDDFIDNKFNLIHSGLTFIQFIIFHLLLQYSSIINTHFINHST